MTQWGLDNLFNPGKRHMDDEKRRLQSTREEIGDSSGGRRIDLEAGKVSISVRRATPAPAADDTVDVAADDSAVDSAVDGAPLPAALEAEDVPAVALTTDEAEIEPEVVDGSAADVPVADEVAEDAVVADGVDERDEAPVVPAAPTRPRVSASSWSRRG